MYPEDGSKLDFDLGIPKKQCLMLFWYSRTYTFSIGNTFGTMGTLFIFLVESNSYGAVEQLSTPIPEYRGTKRWLMLNLHLSCLCIHEEHILEILDGKIAYFTAVYKFRVQWECLHYI